MTPNVFHPHFSPPSNPQPKVLESTIPSLHSNPKRITQKREKKHEIRAPDATEGSEAGKTWKTNKTDIYGFSGIFRQNVLHLFYTCTKCYTLMDVCEGKRRKSSKKCNNYKKELCFQLQ
jgi:hypothetical protein